MFSLSLILSIWFVAFTDKNGSEPITFSTRAIEQRTAWSIATDSLDYAVSDIYIDSLRHMGCQVRHTSRWMNGVTVSMNDSLAIEVSKISFVDTVELTRKDQSKPSGISQRKRTYADSTTTVLFSHKQQQVYNLPPLHDLGYEGQGILMAICDGGFHNYAQHPSFDHSHFKGSFDFTDDTDSIFGPTGAHGTYCLSTIAAIDSGYRGSAVLADYYLMRSEGSLTESRCELDNWVAAIECADSLGVNIFSSSLGYSVFDDSTQDFTYADMNGRVTRAARAATIAARKGMLVCISAGNEGSKTWHYITSPADADSILSVGAVDTLGVIGSFSSRGPSADGRIKPDACAVGVSTCLIDGDGKIKTGNGTSFACPLLAGMAACLWSAFPAETNMQIRQRIIRSATQYSHPNADYGYGIPDAWQAYLGQTSDLQEATVQQPYADKVFRDGEILIRVKDSYYNLWGQKKE